ncbi:phosphonate ABC transporter ATP-binding protein [Paenibacillus terrigena]|uniref:phosphonate ABC transporter ATP-binding protein n=1 Tax=Paenibacillus terrigena TaxID=369333 RepID=UPI00037868F7|nr:ATP-binding cassette domain-containing protein [Paenibacillus terrigena]
MMKVDKLLKKIPESTILDHISLEVEEGEFIAIIGPSGSGKSTFLKCLAMREKWTSGKYMVDDTDIFANKFAGTRKIRRECAYIEQSPTLHPKKTALKNVLIGQYHQTPLWRMATGMVRSDDYMGAMDTIEQVGLLDKAKLKIEQLSGGERQRVALARALVHGAKVILADEPVLGLDPKSVDSVMQQLQKLCREQRITVIAVIQQVELAERYASRLIGLSQGKIVVDVKGRRLMQAEKNKIFN